MNQRSSNLLDEALGLDQVIEPWPLRCRVVAIEDQVKTSGSFILNHLLKRSLSPNSSNVTIFITFSQPFSHYDRILRKLGCNLVSQRDNSRFFFFDMLKLQCPDILIKAKPLATGLGTNVHGQLTVLNKGRNMVSNFDFKVKENVVECFYPGRSRGL
ncbi:elongator complex protein 6 [Gossypium australe]|uniref:Elongator complex protein 6 n=1 Tax=Gossypium australe TaxID=47621 RepID=A0A5B6VD42_9ROSI|nr:elongator complex protein 6 [Gossypium australe]